MPMSTNSLEFLPLDRAGDFVVTTAAGTDYAIRLDGGNDSIVRKPGLARPAEGHEVVKLHGDFEPQQLFALTGVGVGGRATFAYGDIEHTTSPIVSIREA